MSERGFVLVNVLVLVAALSAWRSASRASARAPWSGWRRRARRARGTLMLDAGAAFAADLVARRGRDGPPGRALGARGIPGRDGDRSRDPHRDGSRVPAEPKPARPAGRRRRAARRARPRRRCPAGRRRGDRGSLRRPRRGGRVRRPRGGRGLPSWRPHPSGGLCDRAARARGAGGAGGCAPSSGSCRGRAGSTSTRPTPRSSARCREWTRGAPPRSSPRGGRGPSRRRGLLAERGAGPDVRHGRRPGRHLRLVPRRHACRRRRADLSRRTILHRDAGTGTVRRFAHAVTVEG